MAKADDASSDWIYLREALALAVVAFGRSETLAKKRLVRWLVTKKLPWDCDDEDWRASDAAEMNRILAIPDGDSLFPVYHKGDPRFFADGPEIDWENSAAREATSVRPGAQVDGIKVSRTHLLALLPAEAREREEPPGPTKLAEPKTEAQVWFAGILKSHLRQPGEQPDAYARRLYALMPATGVTKVWTFKTLKRRLYDK